MILLIDNYDSFTYNLYQSLASQGAEVEVFRNDALSVEEMLQRQPSAVVLSPGPGRPQQAGICPALIAALPESIPLLGVCLGHQALVEHYGGALECDPVPTHGKASLVHHDNQSLFKGLPNPFPAGRYHSLRAVRDQLPDVLQLTAWTEDGWVMAVQHRHLPRWGIQFHPESILTPQGDRMLGRFLAASGEAASAR
ncbi:MAG: aminodeoxychorismate/anthranilate synthase component II [Planctomycetota bacterium]|nr:MAG: aminodeoxychorismate/anthranilate synthase component II [Planctomycetota bacterium]